MGTIDPPIGLSKDREGYSYLGVTVEKQWPGRIKNITGLTIQVPKNLQLELSDEAEKLYCREDFQLIEEDREGYSIYTLTEHALKEIKRVV